MASSGDTEEEEITRSLPALPNLVLHRICTFLCSHCEPPVLKTGSCTEHHKKKKTLMNLCLASKALQFAAEPVLYHRLQLRFEAMNCLSHEFTDAALCFMRNIQDRPKLRNYVKVLDIRDFSHHHHPSEIGLIDLFEGAALNELSARPLFMGNDARLIKRLAASVGIKCSPFHFAALNIVETFVQLMLIILPRLTEIKLGAQRPWEFRLLLSCAPSKDPAIPLHFLSQIRKLDLEFAPLQCCCDYCMESEPEERESFSDERLFQRIAEKFLIKATASNLNTLVCTSTALKDVSDLPCLESLRVDVRNQWSGFNTVLAKLKGLRRFSYQLSTFSSLGPVPIMEALEPIAGTLETLKLGSREYIREALLEWIDLNDLLTGSFSSFKQLRCLSIDAEMLCVYTPEYENENSYWSTEVEDFIGCLPDSLEILHINMGGLIERPDSFLAVVVVTLTEIAPKSLKIVVCSSDCWSGTGFKIVRFGIGPGRSLDTGEWSVAKVSMNWKFCQMQSEKFSDWEGLLLEEGYLTGSKN